MKLKRERGVGLVVLRCGFEGCALFQGVDSTKLVIESLFDELGQVLECNFWIRDSSSSRHEVAELAAGLA
eukprot:CAMPEP_0175966496 /NCGR_PEP_ID=MMETSP0108-20121206/38722_1 /TAXON_ID=195067 ORGANISM="Goniomonas pacifica, Strain CCMP1869" /NCGR_SAMPLE_ID=MMETSP0108 /ASSEMBLY_ACC=CAM_ASM_000204 /LENGTH=69 /DNA_ID=CAMNT_0017294741 /DNA_START=27 /DNA_END=232 /DNA_ORIENTATION=+